MVRVVKVKHEKKKKKSKKTRKKKTKKKTKKKEKKSKPEKKVEKTKLMKEYEEETKNHALWQDKVTKQFKKWKKKKEKKTEKKKPKKEKKSKLDKLLDVNARPLIKEIKKNKLNKKELRELLKKEERKTVKKAIREKLGEGKKGASWAVPEEAEKESFKKVKKVEKKKEESPAKWAVSGEEKEDFKSKSKKKKKKKGASWAKPKNVKKESFGPVGKKKKKKKKKSVFEKVKTGIPGLDDITEGGIPKNSLITVSGGPGSGKTSLCLQFIYNGYDKYKEPGVFISMEEDPERLIKLAESFGWNNIREYVKKKNILIVKTPLYKFESLKNIIKDSIQRINAKRLVIDPGEILDLFFERPIEVRKAVVELGKMLKRINCTTLITTEESGGTNFNQEDFSSDGIIFTYYTKVHNQFMRGLAIIKMRCTGHSDNIHPLRFTDEGLEVMSGEEVFEKVESSKF